MRRWAVHRRCGATSRHAAADFVLCSRRFRFAARATSPPAASVAGALPPRGQLQPSEALGAEALPLRGQPCRRAAKKTIFTQTKNPSARRAQRKAQGAEGEACTEGARGKAGNTVHAEKPRAAEIGQRRTQRPHQVRRESRIRIGKISSRPASMSKMSTSFENGLNAA